MKPTRIYLARHGQVEGHEEKRYNGQGEVALTPQGAAQFGLLQMRMKNKQLAAVYSSDLGRCLEGARMIAAAIGQTPVSVPELRELHIGAWEGLAWAEIQRRFPDEWQARLADIVHHRVTGGETLLELAARVRPAVAAIVARHPEQEVFVVAHGGVNRLILLDAIGAPLDRLFHIEQNYGCLNAIDYYPDGRAIVTLLNG